MAVSAVAVVAIGIGACTSDADDDPDNAIPDDAGPTSYVEPLPSRTVSLSIQPGHCWIDPVWIDGAEWGVDWRDQFGYGGGMPEDWGEWGTAVERGNHFLFTANKGAVLRLWPVGHRRYSDPAGDGKVCA